MDGPVLHDAVTLRHFAAAARLDLLEQLHGSLPPPRWTDAVSHEIWEGTTSGCEECFTVLDATWLGTPATPPDVTSLLAIQRLCTALGGGTEFQHAGEAECLFFATQLGGTVATDDGPAYAFAARRLGKDRVVDTVDILRHAVRQGMETPAGAAEVVSEILSGGRHLRRVHPMNPDETYFA